MRDSIIAVLRWMYNRGKIGGCHTPEGNITRRWRFLSPKEMKETLIEWEMCITKLQWVLRQKKTRERHVSLNPRTLQEVLKGIQ